MSDSDVSGGLSSDEDEEVDRRPKHAFEADSEAEEVDVSIYCKFFIS